MNLPEQYLENMKILLKEEFNMYIDSLNKPKYNGIRINNQKISDEDFFKLIGKSLKKVPWSTSGYYIDNKEDFSKSPFYSAGLYYIQEPSAMTVGSLIPIQEGDFVLDLCSAPGGKATAIADRLKGTGFLVANDISPSRAKALVKNIEMMGISNCAITCDTHKKLEAVFNDYFDKIVVDAPCSGEGMFKTDTTAIIDWDETTNDKYQEIQLDILNSAKNMLKSGGIISYSTCTFSTKENEIVIDKFLSDNPDFEIIPIDNNKFGFSGGLLVNPKNSSVNLSTRIFPHKILGEGHFMCLLKRNGNPSKRAVEKINIDKKLSEMIKIYKDFEKQYMNITLDGRFIYHEDSLFLVDEAFIDLKKTRTMRSGFLIGDIKNKKFKPSQNLSAILNKNTFKNCINLVENDKNIEKYLKGETIEAICNDGYVLICIESFALGFGVSKNNKIKNKLGKSMMI